MEKLKQDIVDFIESVDVTTDREFDYMKANDWTDLGRDFSVREEEYSLQHLLTTRSLNNAEVLYKKAKEDLNHPDVKKAFDKFFKFLKLHEQRSESYLLSMDWVSSELNAAQKRAEIEFQSTILKNITKCREDARKINYGEESLKVTLPIHGDIPAPLIMKDKLESRYPEIKKYLEKRKLEEDFVPLQIELKEEIKHERKPRRKKPKGGRRPGY
jgi:hypothetical protein